MEIWQDVAEAFGHTSHRVMGRKLRPFCLYYLFWLRVLDSPFLGNGKPVTAVDLELATRLCSCDFGEAERVLARRPGRLERWWWALRRTRGIERECVAFAAYLEDTGAGPRIKGQCAKPAEVSEETFPAEVMQVAALMKLGNLRREEAWMLPLGEGRWLEAAFHLLDGHDPKVASPDDVEFEKAAYAEFLRLEALKKRAAKEWPASKVLAAMWGDVTEDGVYGSE